jgi:UDP:flavonoid glycosyltransferase YjiC (YdhE family)
MPRYRLVAFAWPCFDPCVRILFSTTAGAGHFGPMIPIAQACEAAGHAVAVAAPSSFAEAVAKVGLSHLPFPDVPADQMGAVFGRVPSLRREEADRLVVTEVFGRLDAQAALPALLTVLGDWRPDVVVRDPAEFGALIAAERFALPQVQVAIDMGGFVPTVAPWLDEPMRTLEQMAGITDLRGSQRIRTTPTLTCVPAVLDQPTADGGVHAEIWRYRADDPASGPSLPAEWGDPDAPLVYISFGSIAGSMSPFDALYPAIVQVMADLPVRVLITTGSGYDLSRLGPLPANAVAAQWWPQVAVMRDAAVSIGHGGFGTTMRAVAAGVPQLVLPLFSADQFQNAERVEAVGAGTRLLGGLDALPEVALVVRKLLDQPGYAEAARRVAADMAALPDVATTVAILEGLAASAQ